MRTQDTSTRSQAASIIQYDAVTSSLGYVLVARNESGICSIIMGDDIQEVESELAARFPDATLQRASENVGPMARAVIAYVESPSSLPDLPLAPEGTAFQKRVWQALREIPTGSTVSYMDIASKIGRPQSARAVAGACASNKIAILIPCHRVVRSSGKLSGYRWGIDRKKSLLEREGCDVQV